MTNKQPVVCIRCDFAQFLAPENEELLYTGGLYCKKLDVIVGKYEECRVKGPLKVKKTIRGKTC